MVKPWILMYPWRMALRRVVLEGEPRAREMYVCNVGSEGEGGVFKIGDGRDGGVDGEGSYRWGKGGGNVRGIREMGGGVAIHSR